MTSLSLRDGWARVALGDIVRQVKDKVEDSESAGVTHYLPGGGISADRLAINDWQPVNDRVMGPAFHMRFQPGHTLYKSRVPHGVGVADRTGICANTTYVLEPIDRERLLPELLPYLLTTDAFRRFEDRNNKGSTNLFLNFSDIVRYEFALPPMWEQKRAVQVLKAASAEVGAIDEVTRVATLQRQALLVAAFRPDRGVRDVFPDNWKVAAAADLGNIQLGQQRHPKYAKGDNVRPYLRVANVFDGQISVDDVNQMHFPKEGSDKFELRHGDILLNEGQSTELVGRSAIYRGEIDGCCFQKSLLRFRCENGLIPEFAHAYFQHCLYTGQFARMVVQTTSMAHLTAVRFKTLLMPQPPLGVQRDLSTRLSAISNAEQRLRGRESTAVAVVNALSDQLQRGGGQ
jgi:type I restriction enzyme S subunit